MLMEVYSNVIIIKKVILLFVTMKQSVLCIYLPILILRRTVNRIVKCSFLLTNKISYNPIDLIGKA